MHNQGDVYVIVVLIILLSIWLLSLFKRWFISSPKGRIPVSTSDDLEGKAVSLLEQSGYEVVAGKHRVPIQIILDDKTLQSRYYIDYFVRREAEVFIVKLAKPRQPMEWTGSVLRDRLLPYQLLYEETAGILYVDVNKQSIRIIKFALER